VCLCILLIFSSSIHHRPIYFKTTFSGPWADSGLEVVHALEQAVQAYDAKAALHKVDLDKEQHSYTLSYTYRGKAYVSKVNLTTSWSGRQFYAWI
jgi:hypothetical protein